MIEDIDNVTQKTEVGRNERDGEPQGLREEKLYTLGHG